MRGLWTPADCIFSLGRLRCDRTPKLIDAGTPSDIYDILYPEPRPNRIHVGLPFYSTFSSPTLRWCHDSPCVAVPDRCTHKIATLPEVERSCHDTREATQRHRDRSDKAPLRTQDTKPM